MSAEQNQVVLNADVKEERAPLRKDLRLILEISKELGKEINLDELIKMFENECGKEKDPGDVKTRCIVSLLYLKNAGFFALGSRSNNVWQKTFFGKVSIHAKY